MGGERGNREGERKGAVERGMGKGEGERKKTRNGKERDEKGREIGEAENLLGSGTREDGKREKVGRGK